jgi:carboxymethylenebutenolidase
MATDFKGYLLEEFLEDYQEGLITRREAAKLIGGIVGSLALADVLLAACSPAAGNGSSLTVVPATAAVVEASLVPSASPAGPRASASGPEDSATAGSSAAANPAESGDITFPGEDATLLGYLARPAGDGPFPAVLVCHENRGLTDHIRDVARRLATAGYVGLAVDLLSRLGGTAAAGDESQIPGLLGNMPPDQFVQDFAAAWRWLQAQPYVRPERVGMVGFCFGGGVTWRVAIGLADVSAAVPFYGPHPDPAELESVQAAVLAIYAGRDTRINQSIPAVEAAMQQYGKIYEKVVYPETDHAFHNDTGSRYDPQAATDAWARTLAWFNQYVATP